MAAVSPRHFLADTHVLLWMLGAPARLSPTAREIVADRSNEIVVSAATAWEIATKHRIGKLPDAEGLIASLPRHLDRLDVGVLDVSFEHGILAGSLSWSNRDPFDRMIAAQALIEALPLLTADTAFGELSGLRQLW